MRATAESTRGAVSTRLWPCSAGLHRVRRFKSPATVELAELTGAKLHIQHISTAYGLELVRRAKEEGVEVSLRGDPASHVLVRG